MELAVGASEATIKSLLGKLSGLLAEDYALIRGVRGDIQFINDELASMQAFLSNLGSSGGADGGHDDQTDDWMKQVRDVSYDIEDCVDDFAHGLLPDRQGNDLWSKFLRALYEIQKFFPRRSIAAKIAELKLRAQHVGERRGRYGVPDPKPGQKNRNAGGATGYLAAENQETTRQLVVIKDPVGVGKDMQELDEWMTSGEKELGVLSVLGFGGVGKTTVAMALYRKHGDRFDRRAMVTVAQNSDTEVVLRSILNQVNPQASNGDQQGGAGSTSGEESLLRSMWSRIRPVGRSQEEDASAWEEKHRGTIQELQKHLDTNRYLLLIDDVWSSFTWQMIRKCLPDEKNNGSRIIVTTRFQAVATTCSVREHIDRIHTVEVLSDEEPKNLFQTSLSESLGTGDNQPSQSDVPERVWEMCGGLPLAIVTMAGLVASKPLTNPRDWTKVCNSLFPEPEKCRKPEEFMRIINHCYNDLPSDLKICSMYLSIFAKGSNISRKRLTRRWISEGFVIEKQGLSVEDVAETCFNQLIKRKILRPVEHSSNGKVKICRVHDMVLEYIIAKAGEENFITVVGSRWSMPTRSNKVRRLSIHSSDSKRAKKVERMNLSHVRSLTVFGSLDRVRFRSFKTGIVQVLDLEGCKGFKENHIKVSDICEMFLLRYLSLRRTDISHLPSNIEKLKYLETLDIRETEVPELPKNVGLLERISNILGGNKKTRKALKLPKEIKKGTMKNLRILSGIEIIEGSSAASNLHEFIGMRKLAIYKLHKDPVIFKDLLSSIQYLGGYALQSLVIDDESSDFHSTLDSMSAPPTYLSALELSGKLLKLPKWLPSLNELVKLTLSATVLRTDNLILLSKLRSLFCLTFSISATNQDPDIAAILDKNKSHSGGEIFVPGGGFVKLKLLRIYVPLLPGLNFSKKATPELERLELRFKRLEGLHGIDKLEKLHDVLLAVDDKAGESTKLVLKDLKENSSSRNYALIVSEYHG